MLNSYDAYIEREVIAKNSLGIVSIRKIENVGIFDFVQEDYPKLVALIKAGDMDSIKKYQPVVDERFAYLTIQRILDQDGNAYIVTSYDSDELWQDPEVIDVFKI